MRYRQLGEKFVLLLVENEKVIETVTNFCNERQIPAATFNAIGAVKEVELGFYSLAKKEYAWKKAAAELEIDNITGNVCQFKGKPFVHAHATFSDNEMHAFGGHLKEATVGASCEIFLTPLHGRIERQYDEKTGLKLMKLD